MNTEQLILNRVHQLPEFMHAQVIDYIDFLLSKYNEASDETQTIPPEHKALLMERYEKYKDNEMAGDSWENVKQRLIDKHRL